MTSKEHLLAASGANRAQPTMIGMHVHIRDSEKHAYIAALRSVYWLVCEEMPNRKHASLLNLQRLQGCRDVAALRRGGNSTKESPWSFNQLLSALNGVIMLDY